MDLPARTAAAAAVIRPVAKIETDLTFVVANATAQPCPGSSRRPRVAAQT
jgi:hypothetical protein